MSRRRPRIPGQAQGQQLADYDPWPAAVGVRLGQTVGGIVLHHGPRPGSQSCGVDRQEPASDPIQLGGDGIRFPFDPDVEAYGRLWDAGYAFAVAAFVGDEVVGYAVITVVPHPHNPAVIVAANDALFVAPAYRNGITSGRLILAAEAEAKRRGARKIIWHARAGTPWRRCCRRMAIPPSTCVGKDL